MEPLNEKKSLRVFSPRLLPSPALELHDMRLRCHEVNRGSRILLGGLRAYGFWRKVYQDLTDLRV